MLIAHYIGPPKPGIAARLGHWLIRTGQKSPYGDCTHTEAIHALHDDGTVTIASSSIADKGVRTKRTRLNAAHWIVTDVEAWDALRSVDFFARAVARRTQYDTWGAAATLLPGKQRADRMFCTEAVLCPFIPAPHYFSPATGLALCLGLGRDVTGHFFKERASCTG